MERFRQYLPMPEKLGGLEGKTKNRAVLASRKRYPSLLPVTTISADWRDRSIDLHKIGSHQELHGRDDIRLACSFFFSLGARKKDRNKDCVHDWRCSLPPSRVTDEAYRGRCRGSGSGTHQMIASGKKHCTDGSPIQRDEVASQQARSQIIKMTEETGWEDPATGGRDGLCIRRWNFRSLGGDRSISKATGGRVCLATRRQISGYSLQPMESLTGKVR